MPADIGFLKSRFAYRIFILFILCAMVPLSILAFISFFKVSFQLEENGYQRLHQQAANLGLSVIERVVFSEQELGMVARELGDSRDGALRGRAGTLSGHFTGLALVDSQGSTIRSLWGDVRLKSRLNQQQLNVLAEGKTLLFTVQRDEVSSRIFLCMRLQEASGGAAFLLAEVKPQYLLGIFHNEEDAFGDIGVNILEEGRMIFTTLDRPHAQALIGKAGDAAPSVGNFSWHLGRERYLSSSAPVFLQSRVKGPMWTLILTEPRAAVFGPVASFKHTFILVLAMTFIVVILLSLNQIRRRLVPLDLLRKGTLDISRGDLATRVRIESGDEFEELAGSFNEMVGQLDKHFRALNTMADIDRAILSELDFERIIETFMGRIGDVCPCDAAGICFRYLHTDARWMNHFRLLSGHQAMTTEVMNLTEEEMDVLRGVPDVTVIDHQGPFPSYCTTLNRQGMEAFIVLPVIIKSRLMAVVFLASKGEGGFHQRDVQIQALRITNRIAAAFSNAYLVSELNDLNWGTLTALARVVDAKSPWTAGHSERVAAMAYRISEALGVSAHQSDVINRAGMLHDIGKVSTPRAILDKKGKLTPDEYRIIQEHPEQGARILEPIMPYAEMLPIVLQHHERYDGKGYPKGLRGEEIDLGARILAVADTFDAMTSDRPYRPGLDIGFVLKEIKYEAGRQFDPVVVRAFLRLMNVDDLTKECA